MNKLIFVSVMLLLVLNQENLVTAGEKPIKKAPTESELMGLRLASLPLNQLGFDLLTKSNEGENYFASPAGISLALSMASEGADGETYTQIAKVLNYYPNDLRSKEKVLKEIGLLNQLLTANRKEDQFELSCVNHLWADDKLQVNASFQEKLNDHFAAKMTLLDFMKQSEQARQSINLWAQNNTNGHIKDLLAPGFIKSDTKMLLTNAIYFQANWVNEFHVRNTSPGEFKLENGGTSQIPLMVQQSYFEYSETDELQALKMLYRGDRMNMVVLLPRAHFITHK